MSAAATTAAGERRHAAPAAETDDSVRRYFDNRYNATIVKVLPGEHYVTSRRDEMLVTVLGSCVSACIRDVALGIGGMNHFMLPSSDSGTWGKVSAEMRYGNFAMEQLINEVLKCGARKNRLEIKVFGGASVGVSTSTVGDQNAKFVERYLDHEGYAIAAGHLRGQYPRRIHYTPATGTVMMLELKRTTDLTFLDSERRYENDLAGQKISGSVELFT